MNKSGIILCILCLSFAFQSLAQDKVWVGKKITNTAIFLDPNEIQIFGSINKLEFDKSTKIENYRTPDYPNLRIRKTQEIDAATKSREYIPFSFGGAQSIVSKKLNEGKAKAWEIFAEVGVCTQFEWRHMDSGPMQRNHLNSDYRINLNYVRAYENSSYRVRLFHVSTHLGDDFMFRNGITYYYPTKMNYEQLDFTYFRDINKKYSYYIGAGSVIRPESTRLPFSYIFGGQANWQKEANKWGWSAGLNVKGHQSTQFNPNIKIAAGPAFFTDSKDEPIRFVIEYYNGHIPYSQFEVEKVSWFGVGIYFYI